MAELPIPYGLKALSVRQPWAWAIFNGKDIENRSIAFARHNLSTFPMALRKRIAIHAAKGMTQVEYESARVFIEPLGVACPPPHELTRGAIIGSVVVMGIVSEHASPWFTGPRGLLLADPRPREQIPATGRLGLFEWTPNGGACEPLAKWMRPAAPQPAAIEALPL